MPALVFNTCCGCVELRTGCLVIGYISLVGEIIGVVVGLVLLAGGAVLATAADSHDARTAHTAVDDAAKVGGIAFMVVSVILLLIVFFLLAFTVVLLVGLHKNKRGHVKAYLIFSCVILVLGLIGFFASFGFNVEVKKIVTSLANILVQAYFTLVIRSHYHKMEEKRPQIYNTGAA